MEIAQQIIKLYQLKHKTIGFAESMTGGSLAYHLVIESSASKVFIGSLVTYSEDAKINLLNIDQERIKEFGVVSKEIASDMAKACQRLLNVNIGVGVTGFAEGDVQEVYVAFQLDDAPTLVKYFKYDHISRQEAILTTTKKVYDELLKQLK
jgi:nicotinamide-nucleotide amidase